MNRAEGGAYICFENRTSRVRSTSVLLLSMTWLEPGSVVDPTPFSLRMAIGQRLDRTVGQSAPNCVIYLVVVNLYLRRKSKATAE